MSMKQQRVKKENGQVLDQFRTMIEDLKFQNYEMAGHLDSLKQLRPINLS